MELSNGTYFVTGIDTDAGKSYATGWLARELCASGRRVITQKMIQTGCGEISDDIVTHRQLMGIPLQPVDTDGTTCPIIYPFPASPHLSARLAGEETPLDKVRESTAKLSSQYDIVLLEGAGGLMVPLRPFGSSQHGPQYLTADYVKAENLPVMLVTSARLGSLNHTLLTLEACRSRDIEVAGLLYNLYPAGDPVISADTRDYLKRYLDFYHPACRWIEIPYVEPRTEQ